VIHACTSGVCRIYYGFGCCMHRLCVRDVLPNSRQATLRLGQFSFDAELPTRLKYLAEWDLHCMHIVTHLFESSICCASITGTVDCIGTVCPAGTSGPAGAQGTIFQRDSELGSGVTRDACVWRRQDPGQHQRQAAHIVLQERTRLQAGRLETKAPTFTTALIFVTGPKTFVAR
jgi:hypothetical protein